MKGFRATLLLGVAVFGSAWSADACSVCMGDANSNIAGASNGAIFLMIGAIGTMMMATMTVAYAIYRRSKLPIPPHIELVESISPESENSER